MPVRELIEIDNELCNGCGECVSACAVGNMLQWQGYTVRQYLIRKREPR